MKSRPSIDDSPALRLTLACSRFTRRAIRGADETASSVTWRILALIDREGPARLSEIASYEQVSRPTATATVKRIEEAGLVTRRRDPDDSRSSFVELTETGRERLARWRVKLAAGVDSLLADLDAEDRATLDRAAHILARVVDLPGASHPKP